MARPLSIPPIKDRIRSATTVSRGGCWMWNLRTDKDGYGSIKFEKRTQRAHRVAYEAFVGPIPAGMTIDHLCRNPRCVNPEHMETVTMRENLLRGTSPAAQNAQRSHCIHGHALSGSNLRVEKDGGRSCRKCGADATARRRAAAEQESAP